MPVRSPTSVCITADDYGLRAENDRAIVALAGAGLVDAVSVMTHAEASLEGVRALASSDVATGLHLVLVGERPLDRRATQSWVDGRGYLPGSWAALAAKIAAGRVAASDLRAEIRAQLDRYLSLGLALDFVNAHQHVHLFPRVWDVVRDELADRAPVFVRGGPPLSLRPEKDALIAAAARVAFRRTPPRPLLVPFGLARSGHQTIASVRRALAEVREAALRDADLAELVFHPGGDARDAAPRHARWGYAWSDEADLLRSGAVDRAIATAGFRRRAPRAR